MTSLDQRLRIMTPFSLPWPADPGYFRGPPREPPRGPGAVAQLGERYNGIVEVWGSIPHGSTNKTKGLAESG